MNLSGISQFDVLDPAGRLLVSRLRSLDNVVLLVGSIVSEWHPSNAPSGGTTTLQIAELLASAYPDQNKRSDIIEYIARAPFEYILDRCPDQMEMRNLLRGVYDISAPNAAHVAIAKLARDGLIHSIITPNYDLCLDGLLPDGIPLKHVVEKSDSQGIGPSSRIFFKIHGSASPGKSTSMVLTLSEEGLLPRWKQEVLAKCLADKTLLVIGFSGLDFEISPYVLKSNVRAVVWNSYRNPQDDPSALTPNAERIIKSTNAEIVHGDLRHLLSEYDEPFRWTNPSVALANVGSLFSNRLSTDDIALWSASVLSSPGYARFGEEIASDLRDRLPEETEQWANAVYLVGDSQYSSGRYARSSANLSKATDIFVELGIIDRAIISAAKSVDALRCIGKFEEANQQLQQVRGLLPSVPKKKFDSMRVKLELQEVLILREQYSRAKILSRLGFRWMAHRQQSFQERARVLLESVVKTSELHGQWHDLQQCRMWSNRLDIPFDHVYSGDLQPLDDLAGWSHLGHMVPEMMSIRGLLLEKEYDSAPVEKVAEYLRIAEDIGCSPEVWKLGLAKWKHYGWSRGDSLIGWLRAFLRCNYTLSMRAFKLVFEDYR